MATHRYEAAVIERCASAAPDDSRIDPDLPLAELVRLPPSSTTADQALDFLLLRRLPRAVLALGARGGAGQHGVFRRDPTLALTLQERRNLLLDAGGADDLGPADLDQH